MNHSIAAPFMLNPCGCRGAVSLNGKWNAIVDPYGRGEAMQFYQNRKPVQATELIEYAFAGGMRLNVPGDFNSQHPELYYYEGDVWYQRHFECQPQVEHRQYLYFAGVSYEAKVWLNGHEIGQHEGGFTPFQFDVTDHLVDGENDLVVLVNNRRRVEGIPAMHFDWWNYGGILRDVFLVERPAVHVVDYVVQLEAGSYETISGYVQLAGATAPAAVRVVIPELELDRPLTTDAQGRATFAVECGPEPWTPENPKLYRVRLVAGEDVVEDDIGFRRIEVRGADILLNGQPVFLRGINFHEEIPQRLGRAYSDADAAMILSEVQALGCNFIRTAHYPQNKRIVRLAERMGLLIWEEIPLWQGIDFNNPAILRKAKTLLRDMIHRDKNRAAVIIWSIANETVPSAYRDEVLTGLVDFARDCDDTRLVGAAFDNLTYDETAATFRLDDRVAEVVDVVGINKYMGWYHPFPVPPENLHWAVAPGKPLVVTEFGGEALHGQRGPDDVANSWSEDYQAALYRRNLVMFRNIPNLRGTAPWVLFDFRSPFRCHPQHQNGWNRKGLISDQGQRKQAWQVMKDYYAQAEGAPPAAALSNTVFKAEPEPIHALR